MQAAECSNEMFIARTETAFAHCILQTKESRPDVWKRLAAHARHSIYEVSYLQSLVKTSQCTQAENAKAKTIPKRPMFEGKKEG